MRAALFLLGLGVLSGCSCYGTRASDVLQRMEQQDKILPYSENDLYADGRGMRTPFAGPMGVVTGTVSCGRWRQAS